jgi:hypothetical protein
LVSGTEVINTTALLAPKYSLSHNNPFTLKKAQHKYHTIVVIMARQKGVSRRSKNGTGRNTRPRKTPVDNRCTLHNDTISQSNGHVSIETASPSPTYVGRAHVNGQSPVIEDISSQNNGSVSLETTSPSTTHVCHAHVNEEVAVVQNTIDATPINVAQLTSPILHSGATSTTNNQMIGANVSTENIRSNNVYRNIVDVSKLTNEERQEHAAMLIQHYEELCNTNDDATSFISPPPFPNISLLSTSTISSLGNSSSSRMASTANKDQVDNNNMTTLVNNDEEESPLPQDLTNVFEAADLSSRSSSKSSQYKSDWHKAKKIRASILSAGALDDCSRALSIALNHKDISPIITKTGAIVPQEYAGVLQQYKQKKKMIADATSVGDKRKLSEDKITFITTSLVVGVHSPSKIISKKESKQELEIIRSIYNCSLPTAYTKRRALVSKRGKLKSNINNKDVKWSVKPCIVRTKKVSDKLRLELTKWILKNANVRQSPIARDTLLIRDTLTQESRRVPKLLLECSMRQLHNELIAPPEDGGLVGARHKDTNEVVISDTMLRSLAPPQLRPMTDSHKIMCGCEICNTTKYLQESLNAWRRKQLKAMQNKLKVIVQETSLC